MGAGVLGFGRGWGWWCCNIPCEQCWSLGLGVTGEQGPLYVPGCPFRNPRNPWSGQLQANLEDNCNELIIKMNKKIQWTHIRKTINCELINKYHFITSMLAHNLFKEYALLIIFKLIIYFLINIYFSHSIRTINS